MGREHIVELQRQSWLLEKSRGRGRFIRRRMIVAIAIGLTSLLVVDFIKAVHPHDYLLNLILLPILLLGGYLEGKWEWKDLEKKFPD